MAPGVSRTNVSSSSDGGKTTPAPSDTSNAAANAGSGAKTSSDAMRCLTHLDRQAASIASGVASAMTSNVPSFISISIAVAHASLQSRYLHFGSPNRQKTGRLQWHEAEKNRAERDCQHENLAMPRNWRRQRERHILAKRLAKHDEH